METVSGPRGFLIPLSLTPVAFHNKVLKSVGSNLGSALKKGKDLSLFLMKSSVEARPSPAGSRGEGVRWERQAEPCNCLMLWNDRWIIAIKALMRMESALRMEVYVVQHCEVEKLSCLPADRGENVGSNPTGMVSDGLRRCRFDEGGRRERRRRRQGAVHGALSIGRPGF